MALALGNPYPEEMLEAMHPVTFRRWREFSAIDPFGEERADLRMGILAAHLGNLLKGRKGRDFKPIDFIPEFQRRRQMPAEAVQAKVHNIMTQFAALYGATHANH